MDTGKKKSMAAVICIFLIFVTLASLFLLPERKIITVRERTARVHQAKQVLRNLGTTPAVGFFVSLVIFIAETVILPGFWIILSISLVHQKVRLND